MSTGTMSLAQAADEKERAGVETKTWHYGGRYPDVGTAVEYVNRPPAQQAGEAEFSVHDDGSVDVFAFF